MMRAEYLLRSTLPNHPWPTTLKPEPMETDGNNDSGVSPGRSSETNSNSPKFANSPHSPDGMITSPGESSVENRSEKELSPYLKIDEPYQFYCEKNQTYSPPNFGFALSHQEDDTPKKWGTNDNSNNSSKDISNVKLDNLSEKSNDGGYEKNEMHAENSLERLKDALEKSSALSRIFKTKAEDSDSGNEVENGKKEFPCPLCAYTTPYRHRYIEHLNTHYTDKCTLCDFTGQNSQDLRCHLQEMHNISNIHDLSDPQDNNSDYHEEDEPVSKRGKSKKFKCKQCDYVTSTKLAFWKHSKTHIKAEKQLTCPKCPFVTEYKHHLEYHLRNHFGSKPYECDKCSYTCVNKSMLNSHMKSHSNIYQYRCADCVYATKYCHSLKLHLRKYRHKPAMVLNADGSPNPLPIIDVYGTRRGPKQKPNKIENNNRNIFLDIRIPEKERIVPNLPGGIIVPNAPQISPKSPSSLYSLNNNEVKDDDSWNILNPKVYYCSVCDFQSKTQEFLDLHTSNHSSGSNSGHSSRTNNSLLEQSIKTDYFQTELINQANDQIPLDNSRPNSPLSLVQSKIQDGVVKQPISPLDLRKQESVESEIEVIHDLKKKEEEINGNGKSNKSTKRRRKGKAYKLERINDDVDSSLEDYYKGKSDEDSNVILIPELKDEISETIQENPKIVQVANNETGKTYDCIYCDIIFKDVVLYTMHMGYHGFQDPFTCNMCGHITTDKVSFFLHIARSSHS